MNTKYTLILGVILLAILSTTGCRKYAKIEGNNNVESETRMLVSFDKVDNEATFNVYIRHDSLYTVTVEAESNLIPHIRTIVNGNTLQIDTRENLRNNYPINIYVTPLYFMVPISADLDLLFLTVLNQILWKCPCRAQEKFRVR